MINYSGFGFEFLRGKLHNCNLSGLLRPRAVFSVIPAGSQRKTGEAQLTALQQRFTVLWGTVLQQLFRAAQRSPEAQNGGGAQTRVLRFSENAAQKRYPTTPPANLGVSRGGPSTTPVRTLIMFTSRQARQWQQFYNRNIKVRFA